MDAEAARLRWQPIAVDRSRVAISYPQQPKPMSDDQSIWQCDQSIPSDTREGRRIAEQVLEQLQARQWSRHDIFGVHLAMEEALVNAIMHGNHMDEDKQVHVRCRVTADRIRIEITDEGDGFDPAGSRTPPIRIGSSPPAEEVSC